MKCILHIGTEKTGTTMLQRWLLSNQEALARQKIYLSARLSEPSANHHMCNYFCSNINSLHRIQNIETLADRDRYYRSFEDEFAEELSEASKQYEVFLISSEHFAGRMHELEDIDSLQKFLARFFSDVTIVCYFREQSQMARSRYNSEIHWNGITLSLQQALQRVTPENLIYNYEKIADNWSSAFGIDQCIFRVFDRKKFVDGDLRIDFLKASGLSVDLTELNMDVISANESIDSLKMELFRNLNQMIPMWKTKGGGRSAENLGLKASLRRFPAFSDHPVHSPHLDAVAGRFRKSNERFFKKYFEESHGFAEDKRREQAPPQIFSEVEVSRILDNSLKSVLLNKSKGQLISTDADNIMQIVSQLEQGKKVSGHDLGVLINLARRANPKNGEVEKRISAIANSPVETEPNEQMEVVPNFLKVTARNVWITFDNGPDEKNTQEILRLLDQHGLSAAFFPTADKASRHSQIIEDTRLSGHGIGNGVNGKLDWKSLSVSQLTDHLRLAEQTLAKDLTYPRLCRCLISSNNSNANRAILAMNYVNVLWLIDATEKFDAHGPEAWSDEVISRIQRTDEAVIRIDESHKQSPGILEELILRLQQLGNINFVNNPLPFLRSFEV